MVIEESDFKLEYEENSNKFDLYLLHIINAKDEDKRREEFKIDGYGISLESAIKRIINYRLEKRLNVTTLKDYLLQYKEELKNIENLIKL